jgi:hypothetical protein
MSVSKIYQFLNIRHSESFVEASSRLRETEVSLNSPELLPVLFYLAPKSSRGAETLSVSAVVLVLTAGFVASRAGKEVCVSVWVSTVYSLFAPNTSSIRDWTSNTNRCSCLPIYSWPGFVGWESRCWKKIRRILKESKIREWESPRSSDGSIAKILLVARRVVSSTPAQGLFLECVDEGLHTFPAVANRISKMPSACGGFSAMEKANEAVERARVIWEEH